MCRFAYSQILFGNIFRFARRFGFSPWRGALLRRKLGTQRVALSLAAPQSCLGARQFAAQQDEIGVVLLHTARITGQFGVAWTGVQAVMQLGT